MGSAPYSVVVDPCLLLQHGTFVGSPSVPPSPAVKACPVSESLCVEYVPNQISMTSPHNHRRKSQNYTQCVTKVLYHSSVEAKWSGVPVLCYLGGADGSVESESERP